MKQERLKLLGGRGSTPSKSSQEAKKKKKKKVHYIKGTLERFEFYVFGVFSQVLRYLQGLENCT